MGMTADLSSYLGVRVIQSSAIRRLVSRRYFCIKLYQILFFLMVSEGFFSGKNILFNLLYSVIIKMVYTFFGSKGSFFLTNKFLKTKR